MGAVLGGQQRLRLSQGFGMWGAHLRQAKGQLFFHGWKQDLVIGVLKQDADLGQSRLAVGERVDISHPQATCCRRNKARNQPQQRGLARSIAANQPDTATCQRQGQVTQQGFPATT